MTLTDADLYTHTLVTSELDNRKSELFTRAGVGEDAFQALRGSIVDAQKSAGLSDAAMLPIARTHLDGLFSAEAPDAAQVAAWGQDTREALLKMTGRNQAEAEALLGRTQAYIKAHPQLETLLKQKALGSRPEIVAAIAEHVSFTGWRPESGTPFKPDPNEPLIGGRR